MRRALECLGAGTLVYALVAACSGSDAAGPRAMGGGAGTGVIGSGGAVGSGGSATGFDSAVDALGDALTDPVREADAQEPVEPRLVTQPCNKTFIYASVERYYAEVELPGWSKADGTAVRGYINAEADGFPPGYAVSAPVLVRDGFVAVLCGGEGQTVSFVVP